MERHPWPMPMQRQIAGVSLQNPYSRKRRINFLFYWKPIQKKTMLKIKVI
jgi:hypothetical protein